MLPQNWVNRSNTGLPVATQRVWNTAIIGSRPRGQRGEQEVHARRDRELDPGEAECRAGHRSDRVVSGPADLGLVAAALGCRHAGQADRGEAQQQMDHLDDPVRRADEQFVCRPPNRAAPSPHDADTPRPIGAPFARNDRIANVSSESTKIAPTTFVDGDERFCRAAQNSMPSTNWTMPAPDDDVPCDRR